MLNIYEILRITQVEYLPTLDFIGLAVKKNKLKHEKLMDIDDTGLKMMKIHVPEPASFGKPISISIHVDGKI